ncbi:MAG: hypothetical protein MJZ03_05905, partial [archaeon]|nr:hypothetical protein [archaeon]
TSDLAGKANASDVAALQTAVNGKADSSTVSDLSERVSTNETGLAAANTRIDNIVAIPPGSTEGNTELIDIRTGADGKNYATAGDAVRGQVTDLKIDLNNQTVKVDRVDSEAKDLNERVKKINSSVHELNVHIVEEFNDVPAHYIDIPVVANHEYKITNKTAGAIGLASYDENKRKIEEFPNVNVGKEKTIVPTSDAYYLYVFFTADGTVEISDESAIIPNINKTNEIIVSEINDVKIDLNNQTVKVKSLINEISEQYNNIEKHYINVPIVAGHEYKIANKTAGAIGLASYDENKRKIEEFPNVSAGKEKTIVPTSDAYYLYVFFTADGIVNITDESAIIPNVEKAIQETASVANNAQIEGQETKALMLNLFGKEKTELIDKSTMVDGEYISYATGNAEINADFTRTDYIPVYCGLEVEVVGGASNSQTAFYDENHNYVSGKLTGRKNIVIPDDNRIKFMRWCCMLRDKETASLSYHPLVNPEQIEVIEVKNGESILAGIQKAYAVGAKKVIVHHGAYDIIEEYKDLYGDDYFESYTSRYNDLKHGNYDYGTWIDNITVIFEAGSIVTAHYTGDNANVKKYFSAFAVGSNAVIDGLFLDASELRYGIHPDFHPNTNEENIVFKNCDLHHYKAGVSNQAIGCGLGVHTTMILENCVFRSDTRDVVWRFHNNESSESSSKVIMKDCYFVGEGYARFNSYGPSDKMTNVLVSNCSWINPPVVAKETSDSNINVSMTAWNNETREN